MDMPKLSPIVIETKNKKLFMRIYLWITTVRQWQLLENWSYTLPDDTKIVVPKDFIFDGASIPKPLWFLLSPTGLLLIPGLIHDFAYRYDYLWAIKEVDGEIAYIKYQEKAGQHYWDKIFKNVGVEVNGMAIIDSLASFALFIAGSWAWKANRKRNAEEINPS